MTEKLKIPKPISAGLILSYRCTSECKHCMYACSPRWRGDWVTIDDAERILAQLSGMIHESPLGPQSIGVNYGLHFTGGEPFLNFGLLLRIVEIAHRLKIPSTFVETNSFWSVSDEVARSKLTRLREAGLQGVLVSVNPFILEHIPFERTMRTIRISRETFGDNVIVYQSFFYHQFRMLDLDGVLPFEEYLRRAGSRSLSYVELIPMGRACYKLGHLYKRYRAKAFFSESCLEELTRPWHVHIDNYGNYIAGYCGGISLGDARNLESICEGIDLGNFPIIAQLISPGGLGRLHKMAVEEFGYGDLPDGYISKCHLCVDIRKYISQRTSEFRELRPKEFYENL